MSTDRYLEAHQAKQRPATQFEDLLGDAIERAYADGIHDLPGLVVYLNRTGPSAENGQSWTESSYCALMARLAA
ncbi:MAG TPA: recombinase-like helix-turn-helix domain-containing protein [Ramlibacter sp.]|nr:recombinase-like helix-turn-helix domain-containing protein [Ramlibacter sp.]